MTITSLLQTVNLSGVVASKPFLALFAVGMFARHTGYIVASDGLAGTYALFVLGALALAEFFAGDMPEVIDAAPVYAPFLRALAGFYLTISLQTPAAVEMTDALLGGRPLFGWFWALFVALLSLVLGQWRARFLAEVAELDPDNDLGLLTIIKIAETSWVAFSAMLAVFFVAASVVVIGFTLLALYLVQQAFQRAQERQMIDCAQCGARRHPSALRCPACHRPCPAPVEVGAFGQPTQCPVTDMAAHRLRLIGRRRCPECAERLPERTVQQRCTRCDTATFADAAHLEQYLDVVRKRLPVTLALCLLCSAVPVVGLVPGIVFYRLSLISGLRAYLPRSRGLFTRWGVRLLNLVLLSFQWLPIIGAFMLPVLAWTNYRVYQSALRAAARSALAPTPETKQYLPAPEAEAV